MKKISQLLLIGALIAASLTASAQDPGKCTAQTQKKTQCRNNAQKDGFCGIHSPTVKRCGAEKKTGGTCRVIIEKSVCRYHSGNKTK